jgi:two-component system, LytTR family, sensor kinase
MLLQPLVENSVKYAVAARSQPVTITIEAREEFARLVITVSDDGPGAASGPSKGYGIGLANVRDRLAARFGEEANLVSGPSAEGGWRTVVRLPMVKPGAGGHG